MESTPGQAWRRGTPRTRRFPGVRPLGDDQVVPDDRGRGGHERADLLHRLDELARTDKLIGLHNRWAFDELLERELSRAGRARWGGEEFVALLPNATPPDTVETVVDRLRGATPLGQTCSAGVAIWDGSESADELVRRADAALYEAKGRGRDPTVVA